MMKKAGETAWYGGHDFVEFVYSGSVNCTAFYCNVGLLLAVWRSSAR